MTETVKITKTTPTDHDIHHLIKSRWSPRNFAAAPLSDKEIAQLFEAARWAASSNNGQPWRFLYAQKGDKGYDKMFDCLADFNKGWVGNAPFLMLTAYKEKFDNGKENFHALHDLGLSIANFTIQAESLGIAVHQMAGVDWKKAHKVFSIPEGFHVTTAVAAGHYGGSVDALSEDMAKEEKAERKRKQQSEFVAHGDWTFEA